MLKLFEEVKTDLLRKSDNLEKFKLTENDMNKIKPYTVFGFDMYRFGWLESSCDSKLGIPEYFKTSGSDIDTTGIQVNTLKQCYHIFCNGCY